MKVKQLINELLEMPMDSTVNLEIQNDDGTYAYYNLFSVVNYEDGTIGIVSGYEIKRE